MGEFTYTYREFAKWLNQVADEIDKYQFSPDHTEGLPAITAEASFGETYDVDRAYHRKIDKCVVEVSFRHEWTKP